MFFEVALIAYLVDMLFGEFAFLTHPVVWMGRYIEWYEKHFYRNSLIRGVVLAISLIVIVLVLSIFIQKTLYLLPSPISYIAVGIVASTAIAGKMLYNSVKEIKSNPTKIAHLVSRDTKDLDTSGISKAAIETYAENISDGIIAPLIYLLLFGLPGAFVYKAINTLDSMVGYRNSRYERFGKFSAKLDDIVNYIPARITAILIAALMSIRHPKGSQDTFPKLISRIFRNGALHDSPNAGYPISAMGHTLGIRLGGPTSYFGQIKEKEYFGDGKHQATPDDIDRALSLHHKLDIALISSLLVGGMA